MTIEEPPEWWDTGVRAGLALIPVVGGSLQVVWEDGRRHLAARAQQAVGGIVTVTGVETLRRRMEQDEEVSALFLNAVDAAMRTGFEQKRKLLSRIVAAAVLDDAKTDEATLIYLAVRDLEAPHLILLRTLAQVAQEEDAKVAMFADGSRPEEAMEAINTRRERMEAISQGSGAVVNSALLTAKLTASSGYVFTTQGEWSNEVTDFGAAVLQYLRDQDEN